MARSGGDPLTPEQDELVRSFVAAVTDRHLEVPAMVLLEVAGPFSLLIQQALLLTHPLLHSWVGDRALRWAELLDEGGAIDRALGLLSASRTPGKVERHERASRTRLGQAGRRPLQ
jgi:hypothetical protein